MKPFIVWYNILYFIIVRARITAVLPLFRKGVFSAMAEHEYIEEIRQVWDLVKDSFRKSLSDTTVNLWFGEIDILSFSRDLITMSIPSEFKYSIVKEKYLDKIQSEFSRLLGFDIRVELVFTGSPTAADTVPSGSALPDAPEKSIPEPTPRMVGREQEPDREDDEQVMPVYSFEYTFDNFIVGSTNKFAHAACIAVANHPATNYNPLFIYGHSGLGKTHLMCAIINRMKENNPDVKITYTKGEDFTNQMISCLANKSMDEFRDRFRKCDALLIDDIQFIAGKMSIQEEFFHTFNALFEEKKQIILTSDRPPRDIKLLEDRLKSRFEWGLLADIEPPDLELRIAIIKNKAEQVNVTIPDDVLNFLGENLRSNIRQIEGAIKKLGALSFLSGRAITMDVARVCISELLGGAEPVSSTLDRVFITVTKKYGISREEMVGPKRNKEIANARHACIFLIRQVTDMSLPAIAKVFNRDHATIMSSLKNVDSRMQTDSDFLAELTDMKREIMGY